MNRPAFIDEAAFTQLLANGHRTAGGDHIDPQPVLKLFTPDASATWLLTEVDPDDEDLAFGLCDLGLGMPELGWVRLSEMAAFRSPRGLRIERDEHFTPDKPLSAFAADARSGGRIRA
ncbi:transposase [Sphingopyxis bauzanensis]|uniref:Transposase n=1 Tax=Sphingopyxis bauzanensis TaxID=651663 RepID=A0A246JWN7_9SPHN|nr:DUF2958 domain-containing protein [Sphingopyxis bauzanensis]OWQ97475.1 transposase [Sphingopyxis bauzanensis]GGJ36162.1 hypothetical protein GCM10011393_03240 [Sphingopyxis bauzanensis]